MQIYWTLKHHNGVSAQLSSSYTQQLGMQNMFDCTGLVSIGQIFQGGRAEIHVSIGNTSVSQMSYQGRILFN